ncbi:NifU N-terminal domain-containing protein [Amphibacillus sp. Q70]|uniref:NifU N-terminal domain-containing protein n=1 Tax=Amphibacillus sp. Q70 TaxID=3453416 RepID=UPI003F838B81
MTVISEATPNPNAMKFISNTQIFPGDASISVMPGQSSDYDVLNQLMKLEEVDNVFGYQFFITVNKKSDIEWDTLIPKVEAIMEEHGY